MKVTAWNDSAGRFRPPEDIRDIRGKMKENLRVRMSWFARQDRAMKIMTAGSLMYVDSDLPSDNFNIVCGLPDSPGDAKTVTAHYQARRFPASWWISTDVSTPAAWWLAGNGWAIEDLQIGLAFKPRDNLKKRLDPPPGLTIVPCETREEVRDLGLVRGAVFMKSRPREGGLIYSAYEQAAEAALAGESGFSAYLGYVDEVPVTAITMIRQGRHCGLYDLATRPEYRHQNYALATFYYALNKVWAEGCDLVTLQAASEGVRLYIGLGFTPITQFVLWSNKSTL